MIDERDVLNSINANPQSGYQPGGKSDNIEENPGKAGEVWAFVLETIKLIVISLAIIIPIRYYLVQPFFVKGASMETNFHDGDYLLIDEISYRFTEPKRGDVIVFRYPENPSQFYIKRIIGLPGETVEIKNDTVTVYTQDKPTGLLLSEYYLSSGQETVGNTTTRLEEGEYFVMGDNRLQSSDSRRWGPVGESLIIGRAFVRLWPFTKITRVEAVSY